MNHNLLLLTDSYKFTHWKQYPPETQKVYSYFESRGGQFPATLFFGLQFFIKEYLAGQVVTAEKIDEAEAMIAGHLGSKEYFNRKGWEHILNRHSGRLPVIINAVPEGSLVNTSNVLMTVENTDEECYWLTNYLETLLVQAWYPTTVATLSFYMKELIAKYLTETGGIEGVNFKLHDFGFRGVSSVESAGIGGLAHLVNFRGTDTFQAVVYGKKYYGEPMAGFSIPAAEHSTITSWGKDNETRAFKNMLDQFPSGLVAVVSDSYDIFKACKDKWGSELKNAVENRNGTLVIRPDSGDPEKIVLQVLEILGDSFGYSKNAQGYKELNPKVRVIQGDGVDFKSVDAILHGLKIKGWSAANVAFGMGGALLQKLNRDTQKFAFKCSQVIVDSVPRDVFKSPITDQGKKSKAGRLRLIQKEGEFQTVPYEPTRPGDDCLRQVFWNGSLQIEDTLEQIRSRADEAAALISQCTKK
jgi:nicotinamide phosphoribosyltransferase